MEAYDGPQVLGMDLHRRRSMLVRMTANGQNLATARIGNLPLHRLDKADSVMGQGRRNTGELIARCCQHFTKIVGLPHLRMNNTTGGCQTTWDYDVPSGCPLIEANSRSQHQRRALNRYRTWTVVSLRRSAATRADQMRMEILSELEVFGK